MGRKRLILIGERDYFMRQTLGQILNDFEVIFVDDGAQLIEKAKELKPDLIILEMLLPILDGFQVCRYLKNSPETNFIPVLFYTLINDKDRAYEVGADAFLLKPQSKEKILNEIKKLLGQERKGDRSS